MKQCKECGIEKSDLNTTRSMTKGKLYYASRCKKCESKRSKKYCRGLKDNNFYVYLIDKYDYAGMSGNLHKRKHNHRNVFKDNTIDLKVIYKTKNKQEALELERFLHNLGYEGKNSWYAVMNYK